MVLAVEREQSVRILKYFEGIKARNEERLPVGLREMGRGCLIDFWHEQLGGWQC